MPQIVIAGIPQPIVIRNKGYEPTISGWTVQIVAAKGNKPSIKDCWNQVLEIVTTATGSGSHIFAFHNIESEYPQYTEMIHGRHRMIWLDRQNLKHFGTPYFDDYLNELAQFEDSWRAEIRPQSLDSALILPEFSFTPESHLTDTWKRASRVNLSRDNIASVKKKLNKFIHTHRNRGVWRDRNRLLFDPHGPMHGRIPEARRWKFTFLVPDGFHFDVRHERSNTHFTIADRQGHRQTFRRYTNVDCHGHIRGGH